MKYRKNILLDHFHTFFRNFNVTQGIWLVYLYSRGFSIFEIALFEGIFHLTSLLFEIPTGAIADIFGRKTSRIIGIFSYFLYIAILLNSTNFYMVGLSFVFCGLSYVFESGAAEAIVYDSMLQTEEEHKFIKFLGTKEAIFQITGFIALMVSGVIANQNYDYNFYLTGVFFVLALISILNMKEVPIDRKKEKLSMKEQIKNQFYISSKTAIKNKEVFFLIVIGALMTAPTTTIFFYLQNYFDLNNVPIYIFTLYLGLHSGGSALGGIFADKLEKKFGMKMILHYIPLLISVMFWLILIDEIIVIPFIILGVLDSIFYVVLSDYINRRVSSEERATVLSFFGMFFSVVMIVVFTVIGLVIDRINFDIAFVILAIIVTVFYIALQFVIKRNNNVQEDKS